MQSEQSRSTTQTPPSWYDEVKRFTTALVRISSISPSPSENDVAREVVRLLTADGLESAYTQIGLDPIAHDPHGRHVAYAFVRGASARTVVLLGHIDTVGTDDYGTLQPHALDPDALEAHIETLAARDPALAADRAATPGDWVYGRGIADMKSGVAITIAVLRRLAERATAGTLPLSVVLLATPDEENESAGVLQGVRLLLRLREAAGLEYIGAINTDYTTARSPGDPHRYIYTGSIGKLLPSALVIGRESHVGDPFDGFDANLLASALTLDVSMNSDLCDVVRGAVAPPPVTLHATDLKARYDVQLPFAAYVYFNVLTLRTTPGELLARLRARAETVLRTLLARVDAHERAWAEAGGTSGAPGHLVAREGVMLTYAELLAEVDAAQGEAAVRTELAAEWQRLPASLDSRQRSALLVRHLWTLSGRRGPAIVLYYSPPFYPHVGTAPGPLEDAVRAVAAEHPELLLRVEEFFPFLSDMSYLRLENGLDPQPLQDNMPVWQAADAPPLPGGYSVPFASIAALNLPVVNIGPYGAGAHQAGERLLASYSFETAPQLVYETIERLAADATPPAARG